MDKFKKMTNRRQVLQRLRALGWALNEEEREDGTKNGAKGIEPAYQALRGAFSA